MSKKSSGAREHKVWRPPEDSLLKRLFYQDASYEEMSALLGRTLPSIKNRLTRLRLTSNKRSRRMSPWPVEEPPTLLTHPPRKPKPLPLKIEPEEPVEVFKRESEAIASLFPEEDAPTAATGPEKAPCDEELELVLDFVRMAWEQGLAILIPDFAKFQKGGEV